MIDARRRLPLPHGLGRTHQPLARHDDALVRAHQILARAVLDGAHAFLHRGVLLGHAHHAAEGAALFLGLTVDEIVVALVGYRDESARDGAAMNAPARLHGLELIARQPDRKSTRL